MNADWRRKRRNATADADASVVTVVLTLTVAALLTVTTGLAAMVGLERLGPAVGGIIVFRPDATATERWSVDATTVEAGRVGLPDERTGRTCVLMPSIMAIRGGSLVIEARRLSSPPVYRVHWAGGHTDSGSSDCGTVADLMLDRTALMRLANVAGEFTVGLKLIGP